MGLGPSMKMTTLHHYHCPHTAELGRQTDIAFAGILVDGVSELCDDKIFTAKRTAQLAAMMEAYGAIVTVDGFGNHHVDFVNVIEQLGRRGIPAVGVSFFGEQGKLVCTGDYLDCLLDINKTSSGVETCVVGQNNLTPEDAYKAVGLLKYRMRKTGKTASGAPAERAFAGTKLLRKSFPVHGVRFGSKTQIRNGVLEIREDIRDRALGMSPDIKDIRVQILAPGEDNLFVNANLDFIPVACKVTGELGEGGDPSSHGHNRHADRCGGVRIPAGKHRIVLWHPAGSSGKRSSGDAGGRRLPPPRGCAPAGRRRQDCGGHSGGPSGSRQDC